MKLFGTWIEKIYITQVSKEMNEASLLLFKCREIAIKKKCGQGVAYWW